MISIRMRRFRGTAVLAACAVLVGGVLAGPLPAWARSQGLHAPRRQQDVHTSLSGPLTIAWSGDPPHGCAAAGLCGVSGTLHVRFGRNAASDGDGFSFSGGDGGLVAGESSGVVRVQTTAPDGTVTTCADPVSVTLTIVLPGALRPGAGSARVDRIDIPSAGRCAGPSSADLDRISLPPRRDRKGYDLSGRTSLRAGPLAVTLDSGLHVTVKRTPARSPKKGRGHKGAEGKPTPTHPGLLEDAVVTYRITGMRGSLTTDFAGLAPPRCVGLDACGARGRLVQSFATRGTLRFIGARLVAHAVGRRRALSDLRGGRMPLSDTFGELLIRGHVKETSIQADGMPCHDSSPFVLSLENPPRAQAGTDELILPGGSLFDSFVGDPLRTRCPGPTSADVLGDAQPLARATVEAAHLGERHLSITFRANSAFAGETYAGHRAGTVVLTLTRVRTRGGTRRETLYGRDGETVTG